jgi:hypothetical protein
VHSGKRRVMNEIRTQGCSSAIYLCAPRSHKRDRLRHARSHIVETSLTCLQAYKLRITGGPAAEKKDPQGKGKKHTGLCQTKLKLKTHTANFSLRTRAQTLLHVLLDLRTGVGLHTSSTPIHACKHYLQHSARLTSACDDTLVFSTPHGGRQ